ncbi:hypothetical protein QMA09_15300 [Planococcus sp. APC 3906]|uniref:hypothetical protein n=1 Tax=Planococcus sp. APC 3906 TaxID=3035194 RepID=UPI0025B61F36|nr:hypothetical protein [Planococcus sp. APC 3906]MDN3451565.1 hypothetical protein [Planococcus sp. APC 3906]
MGEFHLFGRELLLIISEFQQTLFEFHLSSLEFPHAGSMLNVFFYRFSLEAKSWQFEVGFGEGDSLFGCVSPFRA